MRGTDGPRQRIVWMRDSEYFLTEAIRRLEGLADERFGEFDRAVRLCQEARSIARERRKRLTAGGVA